MPAYYLAVLLALVLYGAKMREVVLWYIFYAPNLLFAARGEWIPMYTAHFWSLGVEEQFYLVWPLLLLATSAVPAIWICGAAIGLFVVYGYSALAWGMTSFAFNMVPLAQLDALAAGGLLAAYRVRVDRLPAVCVPLGWASLAAVAALDANGGTDPWWIAQSLCVLPTAAPRRRRRQRLQRASGPFVEPPAGPCHRAPELRDLRLSPPDAHGARRT